MTDENVIDALQCLEYEDGADAMTIMWKPHQDTDSSTKMKLFNVPRDTDIGGLALALDTLLKSSQRTLLRAGKLDFNHMDELPIFTIAFKQQRKGKSRTKEDEMLSLNKVPGYKSNGCSVIEVEMGDEDFEKLRPVINYAVQAKLFNLYVGRCVFVVLMGGGSAYGDGKKLSAKTQTSTRALHGRPGDARLSTWGDTVQRGAGVCER